MKTLTLKNYGLATLLGLGILAAQGASAQSATCQYVVGNSWNSGATAAIEITNTGSTAINGWNVSWSYNSNTVTSAWNATVTGSNPYSATNLAWNGSIQPGQSVSFGVQVDANGGVETPTISGDICGGVSSSSSNSSSVSSSRSSSSSSSSVSSSSVVSSSSSSRSSSSAASSCSNAGGVCNWYGTNYPLCTSTNSGWGWENQQSCVGAESCAGQPAPFGPLACPNSSSSSSRSSSSISSSSSSSISSSRSSSSSSSIRSSSSSSRSSSSSSNGGTGNFYPGCQKPNPTETVNLSETRVVVSGEVFDGQNKRYNLSGGNQDEGQPPVFQVQDGGAIRNVIIGSLAADGIHCLGNCSLDHVWWEDIGEDAATAMGPAGTIMSITCGAAYNGSDKTFQFNGRGELHISQFYAESAGKLARTCGDCTNNGGPRKLFISDVITRDVSTIVGINSNFGDVATIRNLTINNSGTSKTKICQVYKGVVKGNGSTSALGVEFNTPNCNVSQSDVTLLGNSQMNTAACSGSCQ